MNKLTILVLLGGYSSSDRGRVGGVEAGPDGRTGADILTARFLAPNL